MLHVILRNIRYMRKHKLISEDTFERFQLLDSLEPPEHQSEKLTEFLDQVKRTNRTLEPELLRFDSTIESGNLDRAEAQPLSSTYLEQQRAAKRQVTQRYNLFCKVDTNTKGHQQWFYFRVKNTQKDTKY